MVCFSFSLLLFLQFRYFYFCLNYVGVNLMRSIFIPATTHDQYVFSFYPDHRPCNGFEEAHSRYKEILPHLNLSGNDSLYPEVVSAFTSNHIYHRTVCSL